MAKIELPIRQFIEDYLRQNFPEYDFGRGSALNDLVIKAFSVLMQPIRHEIDVVKVNQSLSNYLYMRPRDLDAIAANWGKFRSSGSRVEGYVRLYFSEAAEYFLSGLEFLDEAGSRYYLVDSVTITVPDLIARRRSDGIFYYDVLVRSFGVGDRYVVPKGAVSVVRNGPPQLIGCENVHDFAVSAPNESNFDVVNSMYRSLGLRNLVSRISIRGPLLDTFSALVDVFVTGCGHPKMYRDIVKFRYNDTEYTVHTGGSIDVWCNSVGLSRRDVVFSYVPSSRKIYLVDESRARAGEIVALLQRASVTYEGVVRDPDYFFTDIDESYSVVLDDAGIPKKHFVVDLGGDRTVRIAHRDLSASTTLYVLPGGRARPSAPGETLRSMYVVDPFGPRFPGVVGDIVSISNDSESSPRNVVVQAKHGVAAVVPAAAEIARTVLRQSLVAGSCVAPLASVANVVRGSTMHMVSGDSAGPYVVLKIDATDASVVFGRPITFGRVFAVENSGPNKRIKITTPSYGENVLATYSYIVSLKTFPTYAALVLDDPYRTTAFYPNDVVQLEVFGDVIESRVLSASRTSDRVTLYTTPMNTTDRDRPTELRVTIKRVRPRKPKVETPTYGNLCSLLVELPTGDYFIEKIVSLHWSGTDDEGFAIAEIAPNASNPEISVDASVCVLSGAQSEVPSGTEVVFEAGSRALVRESSDVCPAPCTLYVGVLDEEHRSGDVVIQAPGIGQTSDVGDYVVFEPDPGKVSNRTRLIQRVIDVDTVVLVSPFEESIPAGTRFAVLPKVDHADLSRTVSVSSISPANNAIRIATAPLGWGNLSGNVVVFSDLPRVFWRGPVLGDTSWVPLLAFDPAISSPGKIRIDPAYAIRCSIGDVVYVYQSATSYERRRITYIDRFCGLIHTDVESGPRPSYHDQILAAAEYPCAIVHGAMLFEISDSTIENVLRVEMQPPVRCVCLEFEPDAFLDVTENDVDTKLTQEFQNFSAVGKIYGYRNDLRRVFVKPVDPAHVFTNNVNALFSCALYGTEPGIGSSTWLVTTATGQQIDQLKADDQIVVSGLTGADADANGVYRVIEGRFDQAANRGRILVRGFVPIVQSTTPAGTVAARRPFYVTLENNPDFKYVVKAIVPSQEADGLWPMRATPPTSQDIASQALVMQGAYRGTLVGYEDATSTSPAAWIIRPASSGDLFSSTRDVVYVRRGSIEGTYAPHLDPLVPHGYILRNPVSTVQTSNVWLYVRDLSLSAHALPSITTATIVPGRPITGASVYDDYIQYSSYAPIPPTHQFDAKSDRCVLLFGESAGSEVIDEHRRAERRMVVAGLGHQFSDPIVDVRVRSVNLSAMNLSAGSTTLTIPNSNIGLLGGPGRLARLFNQEHAYYIELGVPIDKDTVTLKTPLPISSAAAGQRPWTLDIVHGFQTPFWVVPPGRELTYRVYRPLDVHVNETLYTSKSGYVNASSRMLFDAGSGFAALLDLLRAMELSRSLYVYIDTGTYARSAPYEVARVFADGLELATPLWSTSETLISYRVVWRKDPRDAYALRFGYSVGTKTVIHAPAYDDVLRGRGDCASAFMSLSLSSSDPVISAPHSVSLFNTSYTQGDGIFVSQAFWSLGSADGPRRVVIRPAYLAMVSQAAAQVVNTYNYYTNKYIETPLVFVSSLEALDPTTMAPVAQVQQYAFEVVDPGLRYSVDEKNCIRVTDENVVTRYTPLKLSYVTDGTIRQVDRFLNDPDTTVVGQSLMAKRMESVVVHFTTYVRTTKSATNIAAMVATYINTLRSTVPCTKAEIIKKLFDENLASYVDLSRTVMSVEYYPIDAPVSVFKNVDEYFGSEISCYVAGNILVYELE